jgi:hypothetical protein
MSQPELGPVMSPQVITADVTRWHRHPGVAQNSPHPWCLSRGEVKRSERSLPSLFLPGTTCWYNRSSSPGLLSGLAALFLLGMVESPPTAPECIQVVWSL